MIVSNVFASENQLPENMYSSAFGILEYKSVSGGPCTFMIPNYSTKSVNPADSSLLDLDAFHHSYFAVIGNHKDASYQYLQVGLPPGSGDPSYLIDLKNQKGDVMHGGMYADYKNLAVLTQTASSSSYLNENDYKRFFEEDAKDVTFGLHSLEPGNYSFDAILFKSQGSPWTKDESCVMHAEWPFEVTEKGDAVTGEPLITIGKLIDVTEAFPPLKQSKFGMVPESIRCKTGLGVIVQQSDGPGNNRIACVSSDTKSKLIERGWTIMPPKERHNDIENILKEEDCVEFGRWLDKHASGNFNERQLTFDLPVSEESSDGIYELIPHCVFDDSGGFFRLNTKHIVEFKTLENPDALLLPKSNPIEEQYRERYDIEIVRLKDEYTMGEKYSFYFVISGHGHECARINVSYPDEDGRSVGWGQEPLCDANIAMHDFEISHDNKQESFGNIAVKNPGTYAVTVIFDQPSKYFPTIAAKEFQVIGN